MPDVDNPVDSVGELLGVIADLRARLKRMTVREYCQRRRAEMWRARAIHLGARRRG